MTFSSALYSICIDIDESLQLLHGVIVRIARHVLLIAMTMPRWRSTLITLEILQFRDEVRFVGWPSKCVDRYIGDAN